MVAFPFANNDFKLFKKFPALPRIILGIFLGLSGLSIQIFMPVKGLFPFEKTSISYVSYFLGLIFLVIALLLLLPERLIISEKPKLSENKPIWKDTTMKALSNFFNLLNNKEKKAKKRAAIFDLTQPKGRWIFTAAIISITGIYLISLALSGRFYFSTAAFLIDIYLFLIPLWFIIRIEHWENDLLRKILFYYQFTKQDELNDLEFITTPAVELQQLIDTNVNEEIMMPINVRFMIDFKPNPENFHSLSIQIILNEYMGNKFPFFVCFLRINNPNDWKPLKKDIAYADNLTRIEHTIEENNLHLFTLSKSPKVAEPNHTSPHEASKIFRRAQKMLFDFTKES